MGRICGIRHHTTHNKSRMHFKLLHKNNTTMNKKLILLLKQNKELVRFIKLIKSEQHLINKLATIDKDIVLKNIMVKYFKIYLNDNNLLDMFYHEREKQLKFKLNTNSISELINFNLDWSDTIQGHRFWYNRHEEWYEHLKNILTITRA